MTPYFGPMCTEGVGQRRYNPTVHSTSQDGTARPHNTGSNAPSKTPTCSGYDEKSRTTFDDGKNVRHLNMYEQQAVGVSDNRGHVDTSSSHLGTRQTYPEGAGRYRDSTGTYPHTLNFRDNQQQMGGPVSHLGRSYDHEQCSQSTSHTSNKSKTTKDIWIMPPMSLKRDSENVDSTRNYRPRRN